MYKHYRMTILLLFVVKFSFIYNSLFEVLYIELNISKPEHKQLS